MINLAVLFLGASLGLSGLVIVWGIAWAARSRPRRSIIPESRAGSSSVLPSPGQIYDSEA